MPTATIDDVQSVINTNLSDSDITDSLDYAEEWNSSANTPSQQSTTETKNIERWAAVINIRQHKERGVEEDATADSSAVYEGDELARAQSELSHWLGVAGENPLQASTLLRDSGRYSGSAAPNSG